MADATPALHRQLAAAVERAPDWRALERIIDRAQAAFVERVLPGPLVAMLAEQTLVKSRSIPEEVKCA